MEITEVLESAPDAVLIERARASDSDAMETLWRRHRPAAVRFARGLVGSTDAEDLVSEAFANIYQTLRNGGGPDALFRPYLFTSVKNLAIRWGMRDSNLSLDDVDPDELAGADPVDSALALDRSLVAQVFRALPPRWQEVLWYTEVEQLRPQSVAPFLGMSANAVAALSHRAREGFRRAWLEAHHESAAIPVGCRRIIREISRRRGVSIPPRIARHIQTCPHCATVTAEMDGLSGRLRIVLVPLFLGTVGAAAFSQTIGAESASAAVAISGTAVGTVASGIILGVSVIVAVVVFAGVVPSQSPPDQVVAVDVPGRGTETHGTGPVAPPATDDPATDEPPAAGPGPERPADPPVSPPTTGTPPVTPVTPPLAASAIPTVLQPTTGAAVPSRFFTIAGSGVPGSSVTIDLGTGSPVVATVGPDGSWSASGTSAVTEGWHDVSIRQSTPNRAISAPAVVRVLVDETAPSAPSLSAPIPAGATQSPQLTGTGEPGATVTLANEWGSVGSTVVGDDGTFVFPAPSGLSPLDHSVRLTQTDLAGNTSPEFVVAPDFVPTAVLVSPSPVASGDPIEFVVQGWAGASYRVYLDAVLLETIPGQQTYTIGAGGVSSSHLVLGASAGGHELTVGYVDPAVSGPPAIFTSTHVEVAP